MNLDTYWQEQIDDIIKKDRRRRAEKMSQAAETYARTRQAQRAASLAEMYVDHRLWREELISQREAIWVIAKPEPEHWNLYTHITVTAAGAILVSGDGGECILYPGYSGRETSYALLRWSTNIDTSYVLGKARKCAPHLVQFDPLEARFEVLEWYTEGYVNHAAAAAALDALDTVAHSYGRSEDLANYYVSEALQLEQTNDISELLGTSFGMEPSSCALHCRAALRRAFQLVTEKHQGAPAAYRTWMRSPWA